MLKRFLILPIILFVGYGVLQSGDFATIASGIAIFIVGMFFMEDGFKCFTGGILSKILSKTTNTIPKAIFSGFLATAIVQSSSLISVIAISFLSAELISLGPAVGIIFGANIGTTATAWIVAVFGMKIKISAFALPMIVFGVLFTFFNNRTYKGIGNILLGLGFIFLGISYMKEGFETLKSGIELSQYGMDGFLGILTYIFVGAVATIIIQSSSATMALIITAVATGQIDYVSSISLAIGANLGTTVTAVLGAVTSNANGKRLAVAHLIFNVITALIAVIFMKYLMQMVDLISGYVGITDQDIAMKLSLFHTIFNSLGVLVLTPVVHQLVKLLEKLFVVQDDRRWRPRYLDEEVIKTPGPAIAALYKEAGHMFDGTSQIIIQALRLHRHEVFSDCNIDDALRTVKETDIDIDELYEKRIKFLYSDILKYSILAEKNMNKEQRHKVYKIKLASRDMIEAIKDIRELQKNIAGYMARDNENIKNEYNFLRKDIAQLLRIIACLRENPGELDRVTDLETAKEQNKGLDIVAAKRLSVLLRDGKITESMASSLLNDGTYTSQIAEKLIKSADILWGNSTENDVDSLRDSLSRNKPHH
ncbi:Na/Pi cotransporter family protein [uncultured Desulfobacter sp.]|uniref:Na/Pi cotransporter family protein n=1 Tax=uncultured Desulfobacter sp. TaxID=240139 RepID=UPI0029F503FE|nr:Na/Pi cotransporter family protein [uncultured Desulfobacter sp.]